jgi:hypothetical protein
MMRIGFLPSDFNPMVLMLVDAEDFRALGGAMRGFARQPADLRIDTMGFCAASNTALTLTATEGPLGIHSRPDGLLWRVDPVHASAFAEQINTLTDPSILSGAEFLLCSTEDEILVKLSRGEYTDDFLAG